MYKCLSQNLLSKNNINSLLLLVCTFWVILNILQQIKRIPFKSMYCSVFIYQHYNQFITRTVDSLKINGETQKLLINKIMF